MTGVQTCALPIFFWIAFTDREIIRTAEEINPASMSFFRDMYHKLLEQGIYFGPSGYEVGFVSAAHSLSDFDCTLSAFDKSF